MGMGKKAAHKAEEVKGGAKKAAGAATGNRSLEAEGRAEQMKGAAKQAAPRRRTAAFPGRHRRRGVRTWPPQPSPSRNRVGVLLDADPRDLTDVRGVALPQPGDVDLGDVAGARRET
ncbi:CsbD family protein [Kitasatospora arboriphila]